MGVGVWDIYGKLVCNNRFQKNGKEKYKTELKSQLLCHKLLCKTRDGIQITM